MSSLPPSPRSTSPLALGVVKADGEKTETEQATIDDSTDDMVAAATEGYVFVLHDPEKRSGEFMLSRIRKPIEDLKRVNAPWTPDHQRYHSITLIYMLRVLDMGAVQATACDALVGELGMVLQDPAANQDATTAAQAFGDGGMWLRNPLSKTVNQLSVCMKKAADRWHLANVERFPGSVSQIEDGGGTKSTPGVRIKWRYRELERNVSLLEKLMGEGDDNWC